jgi:hypothetical protein
MPQDRRTSGITSAQHSWAARAKRGTRAGVAVGLAFGLLTVIIRVASIAAGGGRFTLGTPAVVAVYVVGGAVSGLLVGMLLPFGRSLVGAATLGFVAFLVPMAGFFFVIPGFSEAPVRDRVVLILLGTLVAGPGSGIIFRREFRRGRRPPT